MLLTRSLPPQFLLPAWSARQLALLQQRANKSDDAGAHWGTPPEDRRRHSNPTPHPGPSRQHQVPRFENRNDGASSHQERIFEKGSPRRVAGVMKVRHNDSLFEELFPEEKKVLREKMNERMPIKGHDNLERLPSFNWMDGQKVPNGQPTQPSSLTPLYQSPAVFKQEVSQQSENSNMEDAEEADKIKRREASVLVLNSTMKTLEESDFFRLGPKGNHIEGWTSGIIKVIPGRDNNTLRALGHYFILFHNPAAARAYLDNTIRLHRLARVHGRWLPTTIPGMPLPPGLLKKGEDSDEAIKHFTLSPSYNGLFLRMVQKPYRPAMQRLLVDGGPAAIAQRKTEAENMVLLHSDYRSIGHFELRKAIKEDGKRRNLHWKFAGNFEVAVVKLKDEDGHTEGDMSESSKEKDWSPKAFARYLLSFKDRHEARRFVREWHKRPMPMHKGLREGEELPPVVNAEILW